MGQPPLGVIMCLICLNSLVPMCSKNFGVGLLGNYPEKTIPHVENLYIQDVYSSYQQTMENNQLAQYHGAGSTVAIQWME